MPFLPNNKGLTIGNTGLGSDRSSDEERNQGGRFKQGRHSELVTSDALDMRKNFEIRTSKNQIVNSDTSYDHRMLISSAMTKNDQVQRDMFDAELQDQVIGILEHRLSSKKLQDHQRKVLKNQICAGSRLSPTSSFISMRCLGYLSPNTIEKSPIYSPSDTSLNYTGRKPPS